MLGSFISYDEKNKYQIRIGSIFSFNLSDVISFMTSYPNYQLSFPKITNRKFANSYIASITINPSFGVFVSNQRLTPIQFEDSHFNFIGSILDLKNIKNETWFIFKCTKVVDGTFTAQYDNDSIEFMKILNKNFDFNHYFSETDLSKNNLNDFEYEQILFVAKSIEVKKIIINYRQEDILEILNLIPRDAKIEIIVKDVNDESLSDSRFLKLITEFKKISLNNNQSISFVEIKRDLVMKF